MKTAEEIMEILQAFDLTGSYRDAAELAGCPHHTVARYVAAREAGRLVPGAPAERGGVIDGFLPKIEEWVEGSKGKVRADVAHEKLVAMGFTGSGRTTRRAVAQVKQAWRAGRRRVHRPWVRAGDVGAVRLRGRPEGGGCLDVVPGSPGSACTSPRNSRSSWHRPTATSADARGSRY